MTPLIINPEEDVTPSVRLDKDKGIFEISGSSHPENAISFYAPVLEWLKNYAENPNEHTVFNFHFQYFNTSSSKQIFRLISALESIAKKSKVKIIWHYDAGDADMLASGERFSQLASVLFEFISR